MILILKIYLIETSQGISHARNRGFKEAKGSFVAFIDDDARADKNYILKAIESINNFENSTIATGGPVFPFYLSEKPAWFKDEYEKREILKQSGFIDKEPRLFSGSNMILNKNLE